MRPIATLLVASLLAFLPFAAADEPPVIPGAAPEGRLESGRATLYARSRHQDYEKATFSFEHGIRDDPGLARTRNDWDLQYGNGGDVFEVRMVTDDRSVILDLGPLGFADVEVLPVPPPATAPRAAAERAPAVEEHLYLVHTLDTDSDFVSLFRVERLVPGDVCEIAWVRWVPASRADAPLDLDAATRERLAHALDRALAAAAAARCAAVGELADLVRIRFRIRTTAQGGNPSRLALDGTTSRVPESSAPEPFDVRGTPRPRHEPLWRIDGGYVPAGQVLVLEAIDVYAEAPGDSNGHGEAIVSLPLQRVFSARDEEGPFQVFFEGLALVGPGEEGRVGVEVANSSALDVIMTGRLVPAAEAQALRPVPFAPAAAPEGMARAGGDVPEARRYLLQEPRAVLQVRAGAGGGNPNRVTLLGRGSIYLDRLSLRPIPVAGPIDMHEDAVGHTSGGRIPRGQVWVVTRVTWEGSAAGDSNGPGELIVHLGGERIVAVRDTPGPLSGTWEGEVRIRAGEETRVYVEVANSSAVSATFEGRFEDAPDPGR